jgi:hypothetical protein
MRTSAARAHEPRDRRDTPPRPASRSRRATPIRCRTPPPRPPRHRARPNAGCSGNSSIPPVRYTAPCHRDGEIGRRDGAEERQAIRVVPGRAVRAPQTRGDLARHAPAPGKGRLLRAAPGVGQAVARRGSPSASGDRTSPRHPCVDRADRLDHAASSGGAAIDGTVIVVTGDLFGVRAASARRRSTAAPRPRGRAPRPSASRVHRPARRSSPNQQ